MTHELFVHIFDVWGMKLERVVIHSLKNSTFYAVLTVSQGETKKTLMLVPVMPLPLPSAPIVLFG